MEGGGVTLNYGGRGSSIELWREGGVTLNYGGRGCNIELWREGGVEEV